MKVRDIGSGRQCDTEFGFVLGILIVLGYAFADLGRGNANNRIGCRVVVDASAEDFDPQRALLDVLRVTRQSVFDYKAKEVGKAPASLYEDDGATFAYQRGVFLRLNFSCEPTSQALSIHVSARDGTFAPWWNQIRFEVFGFTLSGKEVVINGTRHSGRIDRDRGRFVFLVPYDGNEINIVVK